MKKSILLILSAAGMMFGATYTGVITDSGCARANHAAMHMGSDEQCVKACVQHGAKYMLYDGKQAYELSDQKTPEQFAAKRVMVMGTLDAKTNSIKVDSIKAAK
jgi:hypothetical protein